MRRYGGPGLRAVSKLVQTIDLRRREFPAPALQQGSHQLSRSDSNRWREQRVQCALKFLCRQLRLCSKAAYLAKRVNAGVGASGGMQNDVFLSQTPKHANDFPLNCWPLRLHLPAVEIGAVVSDGELEITHAGARTAGSGRGANEAAPRLYRYAAAAAERTILVLVAGDGQLNQRLRFHFEVDLPAAPIDQCTGSNNTGPGLFHDPNRFLSGAPGSPHVFNNENMLVGSERETSAQRHHAAGIGLHKKRRRTSAE